MKYDIRQLKASEMEQAIKLADLTFRDDDHPSMGESYPHIFKTPVIHSFGAFDGDKLVSFIGLVPNIIHIGKASLNIFSIGSVCTHLDYRRQGISSKILQRVYDYIDEAGASLLIVSGDRGMYRRNHCHYFGKVNSFTIKQSNDNMPPTQLHIREYQETDLFQLDRLRKEKAIRFEASLLEWSILYEAQGYVGNLKMDQTIFVAENQGDIEGYIVVGIPDDHSTIDKGIIVDWAGETAVVHSLISHVQERLNLPDIEYNLPWYEEFAEELATYPASEKERSDTLYLVDPERLLKQVKPYLAGKNEQLANELKITKVNEDNYHLSIADTEHKLNAEELITLLFGFDNSLQKGELATLFPIPLPFMSGIFFV